MGRKKSAQSSADFQAALQEIRGFYQKGAESLGRIPKSTYGDGSINRLAQEFQLNPDTMRKARQFARGYTPTEVDELCTLCQASGYAPGTTFIIRLLTVKKEDRASLQSEAVTEGWGINELQRVILKRFGSRRSGGRKPQVGTDKSDFLTELESMTESWRRWWMLVSNKGPDGKEPSTLEQLGVLPGLRKSIQETSLGVIELQRQVARQLQKELPTREPRPKTNAGGANKKPAARRKS